MPMPWTYRHASKEWRAFLDDVKERAGLSSDNMAYTAIDGVFQCFRRRLTVEQAIAFASVLPSIPRAIFIQDWDTTALPIAFSSRTDMTREAQTLRKDHNLAPENIIEAVAWALWRRVNHRDLRRVLHKLPPGAVEFWAVEAAPNEIEHRLA